MSADMDTPKDETQHRANGLGLLAKQTTAGFDSATGADIAPDKPQTPRTKVEAILRLFLSGKRLNRFEAERFHDHCLHSTVSTLQNGYGIKIDRMSETVPCVRGKCRVRCKRYWLLVTPENITAAQSLLNCWSRS